MKGPLGRTKFSIVRWWACPRCQRRRRTSGQIVNLTCNSPECLEMDKPVSMHVVEFRSASARTGKTAQPQGTTMPDSIPDLDTQP